MVCVIVLTNIMGGVHGWTVTLVINKGMRVLTAKTHSLPQICMLPAAVVFKWPCWTLTVGKIAVCDTLYLSLCESINKQSMSPIPLLILYVHCLCIWLTFHHCLSSLMFHGMCIATALVNCASVVDISRLITFFNCALGHCCCPFFFLGSP